MIYHNVFIYLAYVEGFRLDFHSNQKAPYGAFWLVVSSRVEVYNTAMSNPIAHIFGSEAKVKIMRLFISNPTLSFTSSEVARRVRVVPGAVKKEISTLLKAGLVRKRLKSYALNRSYRYLSAIGNFLIDANPLTEREINKRISAAGGIKLVLISGVFLHNPDARVDILVVGDHFKQAKLLSAMNGIEAELGKELRYAIFETQDFQYRLSIYDKLIRDILDSKHKKILDRLGLEHRPASQNAFQGA